MAPIITHKSDIAVVFLPDQASHLPLINFRGTVPIVKYELSNHGISRLAP